MATLENGYVAPPSVFILIVMIVYVFTRQWGNKDGQKQETERVEALEASRWLKEKHEPVEERQEDTAAEIPI
ncbi:hypothetical protein M433DRAFT_9914 [Acidomyces richmondensis BFW]|nr:hypothetical protein M433DRAFT_9914 [Acidomyces richmondensis BFW]